MAEKGKQKVGEDSATPTSRSVPSTPSGAHRVLGTPILEPDLFRFDTFTIGGNTVIFFNCCLHTEANETLFVTFTTHPNVI